jgi:hypothetical protein
MPRRLRRKVRGLDPNKLAFSIVQKVTGQPPIEIPEEPEKNPAAVALGRLGGSKGGKARAAGMTKKERSESAKKAAKARWHKSKQTFP